MTQFGDDVLEIDFDIICSYAEIYNEKFFDLLDASQQKKLSIREDAKKGVYLENETLVPVKDLSEIMTLLEKGQLNRKVASHSMNRESSRSHAIFTAYIKVKTVTENNKKSIRSSKLHIVDLAGSERVKDAKVDG